MSRRCTDASRCVSLALLPRSQTPPNIPGSPDHSRRETDGVRVCAAGHRATTAMPSVSQLPTQPLLYLGSEPGSGGRGSDGWNRSVRRRVAVGVCVNMSLRGYFVLCRNRGRPGVELGCEKLFCATTTQDAEFTRFATLLTTGPGIVPFPCRTTSVHFHADTPDLTRAWTLLFASRSPEDDASAEILCSRSVDEDGTVLRPAVLASSLPYVDAIALSVSSDLKGDSHFILGAVGVAYAFELARSVGQSMYLCVMMPSAATTTGTSPLLPWPRETFRNYSVRLWHASNDFASDAPACVLPEISLVHCMVDSSPRDLWKFYGITSEIIDVLFKMIAGAGMVAAVAANWDRQRSRDWPQLKLVLPVIHIGLYPEFGESVSDDGRNTTATSDAREDRQSRTSDPRSTSACFFDPERLPDAIVEERRPRRDTTPPPPSSSSSCSVGGSRRRMSSSKRPKVVLFL